ncbi:U32 family peptidase [Noviherbaspirillum sp. CPCC 100848]|uniref:U32 family peptidase n=1 Tax=Noviherbaspirillum album TaxID=3080276 RepID=A0ABU6JF95_9BURK|nr:U32 family peptidase [Noviherbaspirillum sp. CPCC 100848]MEC4722351.1 U32 family peptidase [Noviherbaspirillum sp. CPCC 100848]
MGKVSAQVFSLRRASEPVTERLELACPAYNLTSLKAAVENGANSIYIEYRPAGLHPHLRSLLAHDAALRKGIRYAHAHKAKVVLSLSQPHVDADPWTASIAMIRDASKLGIDAITLSDPALMLYTAAHYPGLAMHYMAPQSMLEANAIRHLKRNIPFTRVILPRVVSVAQIEEISRIPGIGVELVGFGKGCTILTPRVAPHDTPDTPTLPGCPAAIERISQRSFHSATPLDGGTEACGLPGPAMNDQLFHLEHSDEWHALNVLPQLAAIHVRALRIELQEHSSSKLARLTRVWREAIDECLHDTQHFNVRPAWLAELRNLSSSH